MKKKPFILILFFVFAVSLAIGLAACGEKETYSTIEMQENIVYLTDFSVMYTSEQESPYGEIDESTLSEKKSGSIQSYYLVMEFDMQTANDITEIEHLSVEFTVLDADIVDTTINYANTSSTEKKTSDGQTTITFTYSLPDKATVIKNVYIVIELIPKNEGATDIAYSLSTDSKDITGYDEEDCTFELSENNVSVRNTSLTYSLNSDNKGYTVTGCQNKSGTTYIRDTYNDLPVTAIGDEAFYNCATLTNIAIPSSIVSVGNYAFYGCTSLTNMILPNGITSIGDYVFYDCKALTNINLSSNISSIGDSAFYNCSTLTEIQIPDSVASIGSSAFYGCYSLKSLTVPDKITSIGEETFYNCSSLTEIKIPDKILSIGTDAFRKCSLLENVYISDLEAWCNISFSNTFSNPMYYATNLYLNSEIITGDIELSDNVTAIPYGTFKNSSITSLIIPDSIKSIEESEFSGCSSLVSITLPFIGGNIDATEASGSTLLGYIFGTTEYTGGIYTKQYYANNKYISYYIPSTLTTIILTGGNIFYGAFYNCTSLISITLPDSATTYGSDAFYGCTSLENVYYNGTASQWATISFNNYSSNPLYYIGNLYLNGILATDIELENITAVNEYSFYGCTSLTSIIIPDSVTFIGSAAFSGCSSLAKITLPFVGGSSTASSASSSTLFGYIFGTAEYVGGIPTNQYYANDKYTTYYIPSSLTTVTVSGSNILYGAFYDCSTLESLSISEDVSSIENYAFYNCTALIEINYNAATVEDLSSNNYIFYKAGQNGNGITLTIGSAATKIPARLFDACSSNSYSPKITSVVFEENSNCENIGSCAFYYCTSLENVYYNDTASQWAEISFSDSYSNPLFYASNFYLNNVLATDIILEDITDVKAYAFYNYALLESISIPDSVTSIGNSAFYNCKALESVSMSDNITSIYDSAFYGCTSLTGITIPSSVNSIENYAFYNCTALIEINYNAATVEDLPSNNYIFYKAGQNGNGITLTIGSAATKIPARLFDACSSNTYSPKITSVVFEENSSCEYIGNYAFYYCTSLENVYYNDTASQWAEISFSDSYSNPLFYANNFYLNNMLATDIILENVTDINEYAFNYCTSLTSISIPDSVTSIGDSAFYGCTALESVNITDLEAWCNISFNDDYAGFLMYYADYLYLNNTIITDDITLSDNVTTIPYGTFKNSTITSIYIPDSVTAIGEYAFYCCSSLTSITIPDSITSIGEYTFYCCSSLDNLSIGNGVETIGTYAFGGCTSLTSLTIPDNVTSISSAAFNGCFSLVSIALPFIGGSAKSSDDSYQYPFGYIFGTKSYTGGTATVQYYYGSSASSLTTTTYFIPASLTTIIINGGEIVVGAFYNCSSLTDITIGNGITSIGTYAFYNCSSLKNLTLPDSVTSIGNWTFYQCTSLTSVTIPERVTSIGSNAFYNCSSLTSITIPNGITTISLYTFYNCISLAEITIPDNVTSIGNYAFYNCMSLTNINFNASAMNDLSYNNYVFYKAGQSSSGITVTIGASVQKIPAYLFYPCSSDSRYTPKITSVVFEEDSVCTKIGNYAFYNCSSLTSITIPVSITSIGSYAFSGCSTLTSITFEKLSGWYISLSTSATTGTEIDITNTSTNADNLTNTYCNYYWYRNEN